MGNIIQEDTNQLESITRAAETPYDIIADCSNEILIHVLMGESPHTMALIIGRLPLEKIASAVEQLLPRLPENIQRMVLTELTLGTSELADCVRLIEADIAQKIQRLTKKRYRQVGGIGFVNKTLHLMDASSRNTIFTLLKNTDTALYETLKADTFAFEDMVRLSDAAIQKILRETNAGELARALVTAPPDVTHKILQNMSKRAAAMVKADMEHIDRADARVMEKAQEAITDIVIRLEKDGEIVIPCARGM